MRFSGTSLISIVAGGTAVVGQLPADCAAQALVRLAAQQLRKLPRIIWIGQVFVETNLLYAYIIFR